MFTMSLGGSSVKLETGTQVDTKTRQKPLELSDKNVIFVRTKKDKFEVEIQSLGKTTFLANKTLSKPEEIWDRLYIGIQVRQRGCYKNEGEHTKTFMSTWTPNETLSGIYNPDTHYTRWKTVYTQKIDKNTNIYDFGLDAIRKLASDFDPQNSNLYSLDWKKSTWKKSQIHKKISNDCSGHGPDWWKSIYPPFLKVRIILLYYMPYIHPNITSISANVEYQEDKSFIDKIDGMNHFSLMPFWVTREKYVIL